MQTHMLHYKMFEIFFMVIKVGRMDLQHHITMAISHQDESARQY